MSTHKAEKVVTIMMNRFQVTREEVIAFLTYGKYLDLPEPPHPVPPPPPDHRPIRSKT